MILPVLSVWLPQPAFGVCLCCWMALNAENSRKCFSKLRPFITRLTTVAQRRLRVRYWKKKHASELLPSGNRMWCPSVMGRSKAPEV